MRYKYFPFFLLMVFFSYCSNNQNEYQTIKLDELHNQKSSKKNKSYKAFEIKPTDNLIIDASNYYFKFPDDSDKKEVELVQLINGENIYQANWDKSNRTTLNKENFIQLSGEKPFEGFFNGDKIVIGIGSNQHTEDQETIGLAVVYIAVVNVVE